MTTVMENNISCCSGKQWPSFSIFFGGVQYPMSLHARIDAHVLFYKMGWIFTSYVYSMPYCSVSLCRSETVKV
jgi:hypothetical protein